MRCVFKNDQLKNVKLKKTNTPPSTPTPTPIVLNEINETILSSEDNFETLNFQNIFSKNLKVNESSNEKNTSPLKKEIKINDNKSLSSNEKNNIITYKNKFQDQNINFISTNL